MSGQVSRGSAGEYQADDPAGVARLTGEYQADEPAVVARSAGEYQADERAGVARPKDSRAHLSSFPSNCFPLTAD